MILVTGGAGFIGSVLVKELNKSGIDKIWIVDRLESDDKWKNLRSLKFTDYIHADELFNLGDDFWDLVTQIYHIGACSSTTERDMDYLWENNINFSKMLFSLATERDIPILYASSAATYGDGDDGYSDEHQLIRGLKPLNAYGYSKQVFDEWVLERDDKPSFWFGLKFFNVFGPNEYHKGDMRSLVHKAFGQINDNGEVKLFKSHKDGFKDGEQLRDFIYVRDVVKGMLHFMEQQVPGSSGIYNMGTGKCRSFLDLMKATFSAMGKTEKIEFIDMPLEIRNQYQYYTQAEMKKFHEVFPEFKFTSLEESVKDYVQNYLLQKDPHY
ncbi:MAG: ADP-glyceromanno-heptose 6-epimerase [Bacteriovoracaceae bacterium]|nr:ADP-glyceromanno-heptose 6-epimerase [Bacteriovoracaceae bacterium]